MSAERRTGNVSCPCVVQQAGAHMSAVPKAYSHATDMDAAHLPVLSPSELQTAQRNYLLLGEV